jgi:hypothetical protein
MHQEAEEEEREEEEDVPAPRGVKGKNTGPMSKLPPPPPEFIVL